MAFLDREAFDLPLLLPRPRALLLPVLVLPLVLPGYCWRYCVSTCATKSVNEFKLTDTSGSLAPLFPADLFTGAFLERALFLLLRRPLPLLDLRRDLRPDDDFLPEVLARELAFPTTVDEAVLLLLGLADTVPVLTDGLRPEVLRFLEPRLD